MIKNIIQYYNKFNMLALNLLPSKTIPKIKIIGIKIAKLKKYAKKIWHISCLWEIFSYRKFLPTVKLSVMCKIFRHLQKISTVVKKIDICKKFRQVLGFPTGVKKSDTCKIFRHPNE
jgi:hypothetical protein